MSDTKDSAVARELEIRELLRTGHIETAKVLALVMLAKVLAARPSAPTGEDL